MAVNRRFALRQRPHGRIDAETFELVEEELPALNDGEALVRTEWISVDPTNRGWISDAPGYLPPVAIGETMRALGLGRVIKSRHPGYEEGQLVQGLTGWTEHFIASDAAPLQRVPVVEGVSPSFYLGVLGMTGLTAWVGMREIGKPREGETVVVSAAAGAVGSVAGQLAKREGARVVGIAGGPEKCSILTDQLGFDVAVDYRAEDWRARLKAATPDGIDVDFENVGGELMDAIFARLNVNSRVALCGLISVYNDTEAPPGPSNFRNLLVRRTNLQGFIILDHLGKLAEVSAQLAEWIADASLEPLETVVEGFEELPSAINMLFDGANVGKLVVRIA
jgi:NADPH-dependent curcumin reductase CurA